MNLVNAREMPDGTAELLRLREENSYLRGRLAQMALHQQQALKLGHRLDQEAARFDAMQNFIQRAVLAESREELVEITCESVIDLLECGVGMVWCFNACQTSEKCFTQSGLPEISPDLWLEMRQWVNNLMEIRPPGNVTNSLWKKSLPPLPEGLGLRGDYLVEVLMDQAHQPQGIVIACNTVHQSRFSERFDYSADKVFSTFAKQVGVLIVSFKRRFIILEQIERIRISEERLSTALIGSNVGLWDWDLTSNEVFYSDQWKTQLGFDLDEVGNSYMEWVDRLHPAEVEHALGVVSACRNVPNGQFDLTLRMRCKNKRWRWINTRGYGLCDADGKVVRMIGTHIDVTEYKLLESKLLAAEKKQRRAKEQAERENSAKSSFLASVSHEIRTPLNGILGAFQMLKMTDDPKKRENLLRLGEDSGKWMLKIIGESLDITRIEARQIELKPELVDLWKMLSDIHGVKSKRALNQGLELRWLVDPQVPQMVMVDPGRLRQILTNLINNAFKFTKRGYIEVSITATPSGKAGWSNVRFSVADSGIGFSKEFGRVIFQPFTQAVKKSESSEHGIGLGLGIAKELTSLMGGRLRASSKPGAGSCFVVSLPLEELSIQQIENHFDEVRANLPVFDGKVLLAEDDEVSSTLAKLMMESLGLQVFVAKDGGEALQMASETRYDLIFMDGWMPIMNGLEVTRKLRASSDCASSRVPILALTANARTSDAEECARAGMNDYMSKPLMFSILIEKLRVYLPLRSSPPIRAGRS